MFVCIVEHGHAHQGVCDGALRLRCAVHPGHTETRTKVQQHECMYRLTVVSPDYQS
jgi:hypothetical protein